MKVVTYNIRSGFGLDHRCDLERIVNAVRGADIIGFQEVERGWRRSAMVNQPERLGELLAHYHWVYGPSFDVDASTLLDDGRVRNRRRQFGPMLMSKWPILSTRRIVLPYLATVDHFNFAAGAIEGVVAAPAGPLRVYSIHLSSISARERLLQIDTLLEDHDRACRAGTVWTGNPDPTGSSGAGDLAFLDWSNGEPAPPVPRHTLFMGDFNSVEESSEYVRIAGEHDPFYGRGMHCGDLVDTWAVAREKIGDPTSWWPDPPDRAPGYALRLDYCFVSTGLAARVSRAWVDVGASGSDHKPYWVEFDDHC